MNDALNAAPAIEFSDLRLAFGAKQVLRGASGRLAPGRVVGLLGRNGEGKTSLFKILLDLLAADGGNARILGLRPDGSGAIRQLTGFVPERPMFHEFMTAAEVFRLRACFFERWNPARAAAIARELALDPAVKIKGASKGTLAKIAWVCAVAHDPALLLLDEPTSGLDALVRDEVLTHLIRELTASERTILIANHHMEELTGVLDEVWLMAGGRIAQTRELDTLRAQAVRISGRLRAGAAVPGDLPVQRCDGAGPRVEWRALEPATLERIRALELLEEIETAPLPVEAAFKVMLALAGGEDGHV